MPKYIGQPCTSCRSVFREGDEIVVCPQCGSPYHKECYKNEGKCVNTILHESGESWQPAPVSEPIISEHGEHTEQICGNCGAKNSADAYFCSTCGVPIGSSADNTRQSAAYGQQGQFGGRQYGGTGMNGNIPPFVNVRTIAADTEIDEHTVGEYTEYVGQKFYYYIPKFMRFSKTGGKFSFNFAAFFFPQFWFAYRKMPIYSAISILLSVVFGLPSMLVYSDMMGMASFVWMNSSTFDSFYNVCYILNYVFSFACGIFANWLYYKKAKKDINTIKSGTENPMIRKSMIENAGGVSGAYLGIAFGATFVLSLIFTVALML